MKKLFLILFLISSPSIAKEYTFTPSRIIDGDTIEIKERVFDLKLVIRVDGIDTPEKGFRAKCEEENALALQASEFTKNFIRNKKIKVKNLRWDKYGGRILGEVRVRERNLAEELIRAGLAREYHGEKKQSWCE